MKTALLSGLMLALCFANAATQEKLLATDLLTGMPLAPATDPGFHLGNAPSRLPNSMFCESTVQTDFYTLFNTKVDATLAWYGAHLPAFKKVHGSSNNRSHDYFYNTDGTVVVSITGQRADEGQNADGYFVSYLHFHPPLSEKAMVSMSTGKVGCKECPASFESSRSQRSPS
jgi:hypothetical protein